MAIFGWFCLYDFFLSGSECLSNRGTSQLNNPCPFCKLQAQNIHGNWWVRRICKYVRIYKHLKNKSYTIYIYCTVLLIISMFEYQVSTLFQYAFPASPGFSTGRIPFRVTSYNHNMLCALEIQLEEYTVKPPTSTKTQVPWTWNGVTPKIEKTCSRRIPQIEEPLYRLNEWQFNFIHHAVQPISAAVFAVAKAHSNAMLRIRVTGSHHSTQHTFPHYHLTTHA